MKNKIERSLTIIFATCALLATGFLFRSCSATLPSPKSGIEIERVVFNEINELRGKNGLEPVKINRTLEKSAMLKARDMDEKGYWSHTAPDGTTPWTLIKQAGYVYDYAGENLAKNYWDAPNLVKAWLDSPKHKEVMLTPQYRDIGIATSGKYTVAHFGRQP